MIVEVERPDKVILFGSNATGTATEQSDLDIMVVGNYSRPRPYRGKETRKRLTEFMVPKDVVFYTREEMDRWSDVPCSFVSEVMRTGQVLYDRR